MNPTTTRTGGRSRNHLVLAMIGLLAGAAACTGQANLAALSSENQPAVQFALTTAGLPTCAPGQDGQVFYVWSDSKFYVCRGSTRTWVQTNLNGLNAAARVTPVSPGSQCPTGGSSIQFGLDQNGNAKLDNSEVSSTTVVCNGNTGAQGPKGATGPQGATGARGPQGSNGANGTSGANSLVRQDDEPAGAHCPAGGVRIGSGLDLNGNGILDTNEVTETSYTCNAISNLVNVVPEPVGSNCSAGGQAIKTGLDANGDGILQPGEVQKTSYVCNPGCPGGFHDDGTGICVQAGCATGYHNNGAGQCVQAGCAAGYHDGGDGTCVASGSCALGYHDGGDGTCIASGTCVPGPEVCDDIDNDCDGAVDNGNPGGGQACATGKPGRCATGTTACSGGAIVCIQDVQASPEVCDGLDNDCDGLVDNGNPGGGQACATGKPGRCATGTTACSGGAIVCIQDVQASPEVCDGLDNDCDGLVDNGLVSCSGCPGGGQACATGNLGVCATGTTACSGGAIVCIQDVQASAEVCDGLDNDCDGLVDNGIVNCRVP